MIWVWIVERGRPPPSSHFGIARGFESDLLYAMANIGNRGNEATDLVDLTVAWLRGGTLGVIEVNDV